MWHFFLIFTTLFHLTLGEVVDSNIQNVSGMVTKMGLEFQRLQSELRAVASIASQCADAKEAVRQHENDHTVLYWIKDSIGELRQEMRELEIKVSSSDPALTLHSINDVRDHLGKELRVLRHEMYDMKVKEMTQEAQEDTEIFNVNYKSTDSNEKVPNPSSVQNRTLTAGDHHQSGHRWLKKLETKLKSTRFFLKKLQKKQKSLEKTIRDHDKLLEKILKQEQTDSPLTFDSGFELSENRIDSLMKDIAGIITMSDKTEESSSKNAKRVEAIIKELIHELKMDLEARQTQMMKQILETTKISP